jgi:Uma2 family endonuclease
MHETLIDKPEIEYIGGRAYRKASPKRTHAVVQLAFGIVFKRCSAGIGTVAPEWRFRLSPGTELLPDMAFVSYERLRTLSDEDVEEPPFAPDVAVEVRSPSDQPALTGEKIRQYLSHGAVLVLDVDPAQQVLYAHSKSGVQTHHNGDVFTNDAVPWLQFDVAEVFADLKIPR